MLDTRQFINELILRGYTDFCVVPCSFAKYLINEVINNPKTQYIPCASEAVACSIAAGLKISGKKPIVIIQSSGLTNMGSCITSLLKPYNIKFPILTSWRTYNKGDSEIQHEHLATNLPNLVRAYGYDSFIIDSDNLYDTIEKIEDCNSKYLIGIIQKDSFSKIFLDTQYIANLQSYPKRSDYLVFLNSYFSNTDTIFIGTTGNTSREMYSIMKNTKNFYMVGNMGGALSVGLGIAKSLKNVIVCGGDAEFVMHMGGLSTAGRYKNLNLTYIVFDNEANKSTGGQNTYQSHLDYILIAKSCNFNVIESVICNLDDFKLAIKNLKKGLNFIHVKCSFDDEMPRPPLDVVRINTIG